MKAKIKKTGKASNIGHGYDAIQEADVRPKGVVLFAVQPNQGRTGRIVVKSRLVMARPLVFRVDQLNMDVFHG